MLTASALAILMQVGPNPALAPAAPVPPELNELRQRQRGQEENPDAAPDRLANCLSRAEDDSTAVVMEAQSWLAKAPAAGIDRAQAIHCRGYAEANLGQWGSAAQSFIAARDAVPEADQKYRARLGAMAGNAFLIGGDLIGAVTVLDTARLNADTAEFSGLSGEIELDRARAFVGLGDIAQAAMALSEARRLTPLSGQAWLLSAVFARRSEALDEARTYIAQAKRLDSQNPEILLEAGVIAILSGDESDARRNWETITTSPVPSPQTSTARSYLEQLASE